MIDAPTGTTALPFYDRELSLSGNKTARDAGMLAYIGVNGSALPAGAPDLRRPPTPTPITPSSRAKPYGFRS